MSVILNMSREKLLNLSFDDVIYRLSADEVLHIAKVFGAFWSYDYVAARNGRVGMHALLKSGLHSDAFFVSRILLEPENIRRIMAQQMVARLRKTHIIRPDYVIGVPNGATALGTSVAEILGVPVAHMEKVDGRIVFSTTLPPNRTILLVEDFCTRGTGLTEAVLEIKRQEPSTIFLPYDPVIINRGGLEAIGVKDVQTFAIIPLVEQSVNAWASDNCLLCKKFGSRAVKPKLTDENWQALMTSQLPGPKPNEETEIT